MSFEVGNIVRLKGSGRNSTKMVITRIDESRADRPYLASWFDNDDNYHSRHFNEACLDSVAYIDNNEQYTISE